MSTENTETVISINHVSKVYKLFEKPMDRLKESLSLTHKNYHTDHFALEDISLEVHKGECVGIIGTNGSGKSTLLKIVTGVLNPTSGNVELKGRVKFGKSEKYKVYLTNRFYRHIMTSSS